MRKRKNEVDHLIVELASRYGDGDAHVIHLKSELVALDTLKSIRAERRKSPAQQLPPKVTAKSLYRQSISIDGF